MGRVSKDHTDSQMLTMTGGRKHGAACAQPLAKVGALRGGELFDYYLQAPPVNTANGQQAPALNGPSVLVVNKYRY